MGRSAAEFAATVRRRERVIGYWITLDSPVLAERLSGIGYDHVVLDAQHGELDGRAQRTGLTSVDATGGSVALVRVEATTPPRSVGPSTSARPARSCL